MKKSLLLTLPLLVTLNAQDLKMTVEEVLSSNPIVLERLTNYKATKSDIVVAQAGYYPSLDLKLGGGAEYADKDTPANFDPEALTVYEGSLRYTQNIFKGFETVSQIDAQENRSISAAYSYIEKANDTSFEMVNVYLHVMKNRELIETAQKNVEINEKILTKVQKLYDTGLTTLSEVNKIKASLSLARTNLMIQENTLRDSQYNMKKVLGKELEIHMMSKPTLNVELPATLEEAISFARKNNPSLLISEYNIKLAKATKEEKASPFYPKLDIELSASADKNLNGIEMQNDDLKAMAYLSYNLFNGFADDAALQKSATAIQQEVQTKNRLDREVQEGMNLSWVAYSTLEKQLNELNDYKSFSKKTLELYSKEYELGRRSLLDLLSAQNDFIGSQSKIITTSYDLLFAKYRILDSMGTLVSTVLDDDQKSIYSNVNLKTN